MGADHGKRAEGLTLVMLMQKISRNKMPLLNTSTFPYKTGHETECLSQSCDVGMGKTI